MGNGIAIPGTLPTILPNINASNRALPRPISSSIFAQTVPLDWEPPTKFPGDRQLVKISIVKKDLSIRDGEVVSLVIRQFDHKLYDKLGTLLKPNYRNERQVNYEFNLDKVAAVNLLLETASFAGSPTVKTSALLIELKLFVTNPSFIPVIVAKDDPHDMSVDTRTVLIAPLRFASNVQDPERVFIADIPDNEPTVKELETVMNAIGKGAVLEKVPADVCKGDTWLQDQFEAGFCEDDRGNKMRVVWHLPRLRSETADADRPNLSTFVDAYFPSTDIGVFKDFWNRKFSVTDSTKTTEVTFRDTFLIALTFRLVEKLWDGSMAFLKAIDRKNAEATPPTDIWERVRYASQAMFAVSAAYEKVTPKTPNLEYRFAVLNDLYKAIQQRFPEMYSEAAKVKILRKDGTAVIDGTVDSTEIVRLFDDFFLLHDSVNYGGNIEAAPGSAGEAATPVIGHSKNRSMDSTVLDFIATQSPVDAVQLDTSWLKVGHVDEILTFVPSNAGRGWAILQNSATVALSILMEAVRFHFQDRTLAVDKTDWMAINKGRFNLGTENDARFVSGMLRGKYWEYVFDRAEAATPQMMPPQMYLASRHSDFTGNPDVKVDVFHAAMSVLEVLRLERQYSMNRGAQTMLDEATKQLNSGLGSPGIVFLPAIFDVPEGTMTETFHPNLVNMLVVGSHVMMPRPFGPRMKAADAVTVLKKVVDSSLHANVSVSFVKRMRLEIQTLNIRNFAETDYHQQIPSSEIKLYGYPDTPDDFGERLVQANRTAFTAEATDPVLKDGWRTLTIPEKTVDLFEFYTAVVLSNIGLTVHWIDTWYYHIRHGGLHCGTNAIRKP